MGCLVAGAVGLVDFAELHLADRLGGALGIALAEDQHVLMGAAEFAGRFELPPGADWQRTDGGDKDRIVVEPGTCGLEEIGRASCRERVLMPV